MKKILSFLLLFLMITPGSLLAQSSGDPLDVSTPSYSPEEACILELRRIVEPKFSDVSFASLKKINAGGKESTPFSVTSHTDFVTYSALPVPTGRNAIQWYPNDLDKPGLNGRKTEPNKVYKANKTHIAPILHTDGTRTAIGPFDGHPQYIDGYYVDTRILTFGERLNNFFFPVKNRKQVNPSTGNVFPTGMGYDDFREYMIYTHHIAPHKEPDPSKRFLSCGLVKVFSQSGPVWDLAVDNYYGNSFVGSSYLVDEANPLEKGGHTFVKADVKIQGLTQNDALEEKNYFQFQVIALAYDNGSDFINETVTFPLQEQSMTAPDLQNDMRKAIVAFNDLVATTPMTIKGGVASADTLLSVKPGDLFASVLEDVQEITSASPTGGLALEGGVLYDTYKEVEKIQDPNLRSYMETALVPGYEDVFKKMKEEDLPPFFQAMKNCPLSFDEKVQNVQYALENVSGGKNLTPENVEYLHLDFGECTVPYMDARQKILEESNLYDQTLGDILNNQDGIQVDDPSKLSLAELKALEEKAYQQQVQKMEQKEVLEKASTIYKVCGKELLQEKLRLNRGEITQDVFEQETTQKAEECNNQLEELVPQDETLAETFPVFEFEYDVEEQFAQPEPQKEVVIETNKAQPPVLEEPVEKPVVRVWWKQKYIYFVVSGILALLGFIVLFAGMMNKKQ